MPWEGRHNKPWRPVRSRELCCRSSLCSPGSRGLSGRLEARAVLPRASAFGLSPGLESPGPLGRFVIGVVVGVSPVAHDESFPPICRILVELAAPREAAPEELE